MSSEDNEESEASKKIDNWLLLSEKKLVILLAETSWSGGARIMEESLDKITSNNLSVISDSFDVEKFPSIKKYFNVQQVPSTILLQSGEVVAFIHGTVSRRKLSGVIEEFLV